MDGGRDTRKGRQLEAERQKATVSEIRPVKVLYSKDDRQPQSTSMGPRPAMTQLDPSLSYRRPIPRPDAQSDFWAQNLKPAPDVRAEQLQAEFLSTSRPDLHQGQPVAPYQRRGYPVDMPAGPTGYEYQDYNRQVPPMYGQMGRPMGSNYQAYQGQNQPFAPAYQQYDRPYYSVQRYENEYMNPRLWSGPPAANPTTFTQDIQTPLYNTSHDYFHSGRTTLPPRMQQGGAYRGYTTPPAYNMRTAQGNMAGYQDQSYSPQSYMINQAVRTIPERPSTATTKGTDSSSGSAEMLRLYDISKLPPEMQSQVYPQIEAGNLSTQRPNTGTGQVLLSGADDGKHKPIVVASTRQELSKTLDEVRQHSMKNADPPSAKIEDPSVETDEESAEEELSECSEELDHAAVLLQEAIMDAGIVEIDGVLINRNSHQVPQDNDPDGKDQHAIESHAGEEGERVEKANEIQLEAQEINVSSRASVDSLTSSYQHDSNEGTGSGARGTDVCLTKSTDDTAAVTTQNILVEPSESSRHDAQSLMSCTEQENIIESLILCCTDFDQSTEPKQPDVDTRCRQPEPSSAKHTLDQEIAEFMGNTTWQLYTEGQDGGRDGPARGGAGLFPGWFGSKEESRLTTFIDGDIQDARQTYGSMGNEILHPCPTFEEDGSALWYPYCETDAGYVDYVNNNLLPFGPHTGQYVSGPDATFPATEWGRSLGSSHPVQDTASLRRHDVNEYSVYSMCKSGQAADLPLFNSWDIGDAGARTVDSQVDDSGRNTVIQGINQYTNMVAIMPCPTTEMGQAEGFPGICFADYMSESTQDVVAAVNSSDPTQSETNLAYMWQLAESFETPSISCKEVKGETIQGTSDCGDVFVNGNMNSEQTAKSGVNMDRAGNSDELKTDQSGLSSGTPCKDIGTPMEDSENQDGGGHTSTPRSNSTCEVSRTSSPDEGSRCVESNVSRSPLCPDRQTVPAFMSSPVDQHPSAGEALDELNSYLESILQEEGSRTENQ
ncbi:uncharacterized protein LOC124146244 [Haliotis rufescens]|uniref:uncharacterized protein LOC124146244 n=1 Tax=Haliotis rufescens TaxID=6454 RepID=UPI00201E8FAE|nr:uncharacterized protein LOC124146244 [Haliotis rufescens]